MLFLPCTFGVEESVSAVGIDALGVAAPTEFFKRVRRARSDLRDPHGVIGSILPISPGRGGGGVWNRLEGPGEGGCGDWMDYTKVDF